ncbi:MAG: hypothetical protein A2X64_01775 [Ignavibacteria bacterium GWF2_33_9]|nr:MAG: hypothetical protein A2X64_01775 [Ignavibacteria bacterium GWF2_33_9]
MYLLLIVQQILASFTHIIAKDVTAHIHPLAILFIRAFLAVIFFQFWVWFRKSKRKIEPKDYLTFIILGFLNIPMNQFLFLTAIKMTTAPNIALAYSFSPVFVFIIAHFFFNEKIRWKGLLGIFISVVGSIFVLMENGIDFSNDVFFGNILGGIASLAWALYTVIGRDISRKYGAVFSSSVSMQIGFFLYIIIFFFLDVKINIYTFSFIDWLEIAYLGIITSGVSYALWYYALKHIESGKVAIFNNLQPVLTTVFAIIFFHNQLTIPFISGGLLILFGVYITQKN